MSVGDSQSAALGTQSAFKLKLSPIIPPPSWETPGFETAPVVKSTNVAPLPGS